MGKVGRGLEFFVVALVEVTQRKASPLAVQPTVCRGAEKAALKERKKKRAKRAKRTKRKPQGRPQGSRNKDQQELKRSPELVRINEWLSA